MATSTLPPQTASITPEAFPNQFAFATGRRSAAIIITLFLIAGFFFRAGGLGTESLSEDELNKLQTVEEYRTNGLSGKNGEHPFLMKGLQTVSIAAAERISSVTGQDIAVEAALRFPIALFGTLSILLIFLLTSALFGRSIAVVAAGLYALEPVAIGFDRIAKEDGLVVFFFLLTQLLWVWSQARAQRGESNWVWYAWGSGAAFAGLMASKYYPHLLAISGGYYNIFKHVPTNLWSMRAKRWIIFFLVMGIAFLILNPTILLPETWREMIKFSSENRIGHDSYEYMGDLYRNQMSAWLSGVPWTFYYVFMAVKTSLPTLIFFFIGLPLIFRRKMGDGRFLIFFWAFMWFMPFTFLGGKFTRYFAFVTPLLCIVAAVGFYYTVKWISERIAVGRNGQTVLETALLASLMAVPFISSFGITPHFRLFMNYIGETASAAGKIFPHDEFYDAATRPAMEEIARLARRGATIASETPGVYEFYARQMGREDLIFVSLSDDTAVSRMAPGDMIVLARGRRYFSNASIFKYLRNETSAFSEIRLSNIPAVWVYTLNETTAAQVHALANAQS